MIRGSELNARFAPLSDRLQEQVRHVAPPANFRQEGYGLLCGVYESCPKSWMVDEIPGDFGEELLECDIKRMEPYLERVIKRIRHSLQRR